MFSSEVLYPIEASQNLHPFWGQHLPTCLRCNAGSGRPELSRRKEERLIKAVRHPEIPSSLPLFSVNMTQNVLGQRIMSRLLTQASDLRELLVALLLSLYPIGPYPQFIVYCSFILLKTSRHLGFADPCFP